MGCWKDGAGHFPAYFDNPTPVNIKVNHKGNDHQDASPGMDQVPGAAGEEDHGIHYPVAAAGNKEQVQTADGGNDETEPDGDIDQQVGAAALVEAALPLGEFTPNTPSHAGDPVPVDDDVNQGCNHHQDAEPGVQVFPGVPFEEYGDAVHRVAPALVATDRQKEEVDSCKRGDHGAKEEHGVDQPVVAGLRGN